MLSWFVVAKFVQFVLHNLPVRRRVFAQVYLFEVSKLRRARSRPLAGILIVKKREIRKSFSFLHSEPLTSRL
jgi:hypothetical protein